MLQPPPAASRQPRPFAVTDDVRHVVESIGGNLQITFRGDGDAVEDFTIGQPVQMVEFPAVEGGELISHIPTWVPLQWDSDESYGLDLQAELRGVVRSSVTGDFTAQYVVTVVGHRTDHRAAGHVDAFPPCDYRWGIYAEPGQASRICAHCGRGMVREAIADREIWVCPSGRHQQTKSNS